MTSQNTINFMKQQGFTEEESLTRAHFVALNFQPRIIGPLVLLGIIFQSPVVFLALSAALWWSAALPSLNPFETLYNRAIAITNGQPLLTPAPAPRRFAQAMAGALLLVIGISLLLGSTFSAYVFEAVMVLSMAVLLFGKFCLASYIYYLLRGQLSFANSTLPWARSR
jgi:hypothetical protein